jgi:hypothetical protein
MRLGIWIFGLAQIATGAIDLIWGALDPAHQPLQAWGDHVPGSALYAYAIGVMLVAGARGYSARARGDPARP